MKLIIKQQLINEPIEKILKQVRLESNGYLTNIGKENNDNIQITCPFHKSGKEHKPSCFVYCNETHPTLEYGFYKCFTCGAKGSLAKLIGKCFDSSVEFGEEWLIEHYGNTVYNDFLDMPDILLEPPCVNYLPESELEKYNFFHPYMFKRKLTEEVIKKFKIGFDQSTNCITFPLWDINGNLVSISRRNVINKSFNYEKNKDKVVYLLNFIIKENYTTVFVTESQINALTLWSWGFPAIALCGTGSKQQYNILKKSGIRHYYLALDGDEAGYKGTERFIKNMPNDILIDIVNIPPFKDVNDLSKEEFINLSIKKG